MAVTASKKASKVKGQDSKAKGEVSFGVVAIGSELGISGDTGLEGLHEKVSKLRFSIPVHFSSHHRNDPNKSAWDEEEKALKQLKKSI